MPDVMETGENTRNACYAQGFGGFPSSGRIYKFQERNMHPWSPGLNLEFIYSVNVLYLMQESRKGLELLHWRG